MPKLHLSQSARTSPQARLRLNAQLKQGIALLSMSTSDLLAWASVAATSVEGVRVTRSLAGPYGGFRPILDMEALAAPEGSLIAHLVEQTADLGLASKERAIALVLLEELEPTGWLGASMARLERLCGVGLSEIEAVLTRLQGLEPSGVFARSLAECLELQARAAGELSPEMASLLAHLPEVGRGDFASISEVSGFSEESLVRAAGVLKGYDPKPGLAFSGWQPPPAPPDFVLVKEGGTWVARPSGEDFGYEIDAQASHLRHIRHGLAKRESSGLALANHIAGLQNSWLEGGDLIALRTKDLAASLGLSVSTVNRLLGAITVKGPRGTCRLRDLSPAPFGNGSVPMAMVLQQMSVNLSVSGRDSLSDQAIASRMSEKGICISRRAVAKHRAAYL